MPYNKKPSSVTRMYDKKGKQSGLMMEGSVAHMDHGSAAHHSGKSKSHVKPGKNYPDDGHLHYKDGKKVESPGVSETNQLTITPGAVSQMSPYKMHGDDSTPHPEKKKEAKALTEKQKYQMAATAVGDDPSFTLKTFDDPRSGRSIVETKRSLKKKDPKLYADLYDN